MEKATFAAGCFWHVEEVFREVKGVVDTKVGYTGGNVKNPSYEKVCTDETGHAEAIEITFDPKIVSYEELLNVFWKIHDPTQMNRQGPDIGKQYRTAIFYHNEKQKKLAEKSKKEQQKNYQDKIATEIVSLKDFYKAEEYHQRYMEKMNNNPINNLINKFRH
ncbi:peptide-methionine (S)-S-oxide reductase MsrA [Candidatus Woesearchaeota archaeon]|nr:peptide-methionine (S)-S-oxide reductase MsrA [Candidatus Woesearchaeota archaeon]